jgi:hypothetical protein
MKNTFGESKIILPPETPQRKNLASLSPCQAFLYVKAQHVLNNYKLEWFNEHLHPQQ